MIILHTLPCMSINITHGKWINQLKLTCHQLVKSTRLEDVSGLPLVTELAGHGLGDVLPRDLHCGRVPCPSLPAPFRHGDLLGHNNITKNCICKIYRLFRLFKIKVQADARWWIMPHMPRPGTARPLHLPTHFYGAIEAGQIFQTYPTTCHSSNQRLVTPSTNLDSTKKSCHSVWRKRITPPPYNLLSAPNW